tara:strand:+ start:3680 stop:5488 length:1809 start_codon:yes stop_codon:yes gene_type:complete
MVMKKIKYIDGIRFYRAIVVGINKLISHQDYLNQINVFPVPDGDTGTNMAFTVSEILEGTSGTVSSNIGEMTQTVADLALDGARGNSGAILAQFFIGLSEGLEGKNKMSVNDFSNAFQKASDNAWSALSNPQEGTILTIFKDLSSFLSDYTSDPNNDDFLPLMNQCLEKAQESLDSTPEKMKLLKKAGVVDAGAQGFVDLLKGINEFIQSGKIKELSVVINTPKELEEIENNHDYSNLTYQFCTECILEGDNLNKEEIKAKLMTIGDSLVLAGSNKKAKIHIHVNKPHELFEICNQYGLTKNHKADDMFKQQQLVQADKSNKIALVVDSGADFNTEKYFDIFTVPVRYSFGKQDYIDKVSQSVDDFYNELKNNPIHPKTSQPTPGDFRRQYQYLNSYYKSIISIHIPKKLSGTYQSAVTAAKNTTGANISVVDGNSMSVGLGLVIQKVASIMEEGLNHDEIISKVEDVIKDTEVFTAVRDLSYSVKGGRVPKIIKTISNIFNFKPILSINKDGLIKPSDIYFGKKNIPEKIFKKILKKIDQTFKYKIAIGHALCKDDGEKLKSLFESRPDLFQKVELLEIGGALGVHTGPGSLSVAFQKIND